MHAKIYGLPKASVAVILDLDFDLLYFVITTWLHLIVPPTESA